MTLLHPVMSNLLLFYLSGDGLNVTPSMVLTNHYYVQTSVRIFREKEYIAASLTVRQANLSVPLQRLHRLRYSTKALTVFHRHLCTSQATACLHWWTLFFSAKNKRKAGFLHAIKTLSLHHKHSSVPDVVLHSNLYPQITSVKVPSTWK